MVPARRGAAGFITQYQPLPQCQNCMTLATKCSTFTRKHAGDLLNAASKGLPNADMTPREAYDAWSPVKLNRCQSTSFTKRTANAVNVLSTGNPDADVGREFSARVDHRTDG